MLLVITSSLIVLILVIASSGWSVVRVVDGRWSESWMVSGQSCVRCRMLLMTKSHHQRDDSSPVDKEEVQDIGQVGQLC